MQHTILNFIYLTFNKEYLGALLAQTSLVSFLKQYTSHWIFSPNKFQMWWMTYKNTRVQKLCGEGMEQGYIFIDTLVKLIRHMTSFIWQNVTKGLSPNILFPLLPYECITLLLSENQHWMKYHCHAINFNNSTYYQRKNILTEKINL